MRLPRHCPACGFVWQTTLAGNKLLYQEPHHTEHMKILCPECVKLPAKERGRQVWVSTQKNLGQKWRDANERRYQMMRWSQLGERLRDILTAGNGRAVARAASGRFFAVRVGRYVRIRQVVDGKVTQLTAEPILNWIPGGHPPREWAAL